MDYRVEAEEIRADVARGLVSARVQGGFLAISGARAKHERFLQDQYRWAGIRPDGKGAWVVPIAKMYASDLQRTLDLFGVEIDGGRL